MCVCVCVRERERERERPDTEEERTRLTRRDGLLTHRDRDRDTVRDRN